MELDLNDVPIEVFVHIIERNNKPAIELRRVTTDLSVVKHVVSSAFHQEQIKVLPKFSNTMQSLNSLIKKGFLFEKDGQFFWVL